MIQEIIERKKQGIDCTEQESAEIKMFFKKEANLSEKELIESLFPLEYCESIQESENNKA